MLDGIDRTPWRCKRCGQLKKDAAAEVCEEGKEHDWVAKVWEIDSLPYTPEDYRVMNEHFMAILDTPEGREAVAEAVKTWRENPVNLLPDDFVDPWEEEE